jgi:hypothetical protein
VASMALSPTSGGQSSAIGIAPQTRMTSIDGTSGPPARSPYDDGCPTRPRYSMPIESPDIGIGPLAPLHTVMVDPVPRSNTRFIKALSSVRLARVQHDGRGGRPFLSRHHGPNVGSLSIISTS